MATGAYRIALMLHEDTHTNTQTRHTVIDTNRYHCSLHNTTSLGYRQLRTVIGNRDLGVPCATLVVGASDVWLQQVVRVVDRRTLSQPMLLVLNHCKFLYVSVYLLITSDYRLLTKIKKTNVKVLYCTFLQIPESAVL